MPSDSPNPELLAAVVAIARDVDEMVAHFVPILEHWRNMAAHARGGAVMAMVREQITANVLIDGGREVAERISNRLHHALRLDPEYERRVRREVDVAQARANLLLCTDADMLRQQIEEHDRSCTDAECYIVALLAERLATLAPH